MANDLKTRDARGTDSRPEVAMARIEAVRVVTLNNAISPKQSPALSTRSR